MLPGRGLTSVLRWESIEAKARCQPPNPGAKHEPTQPMLWALRAARLARLRGGRSITPGRRLLFVDRGVIRVPSHGVEPVLPAVFSIGPSALPVQARGPLPATGGRESRLGANHLQTNRAGHGGTGRSSAARTPNRTARDGTRRNRRHKPTGLITQRLAGSTPARRNERSRGHEGCRPGATPVSSCV
jgi:hypothetical protein